MGKHTCSTHGDGAGTVSPLPRSPFAAESLRGVHAVKAHKHASTDSPSLPAATAAAVTHMEFSLSPVPSKHTSMGAASAAQAQAAIPAQAAPSTPSSLSLASTLGALAAPVSVAARQVLRTWVGAVSSGVTRALRLRRDWKEGQGARRKLAAVMRARAEERVAAKRREQMAMERLHQLEQQIHFMHQQLMTQSGADVQSDIVVGASPRAAVPMAPAMSVPVAPPMSVPQAPPMAPPMAPIAHAASSAAAAAASHSAAPSSKPTAASLVAAAGKLRSVSSDAQARPAPRTAAGITLDNLRQLSNSSFLTAALNARFQRSNGAQVAVRRPRVSMTALRSSAPIQLATPMSTRTGIIYESAFSPMTPASEEQWTPAR